MVTEIGPLVMIVPLIGAAVGMLMAVSWPGRKTDRHSLSRDRPMMNKGQLVKGAVGENR